MVTEERSMKTDNVIQFPKEQTRRISLRQKHMQSRAWLALSILSVLILTVFMNQWMIRPEIVVVPQGGRGLASIDSARVAQDIKWEHELAQALSSAQGKPARFAVKPTLRDELIFGYLEGKYGMKIAEGRIESLEFIDAQAGDQPLVVRDRALFLNRYKDVFALDFAQISAAGSESGVETYNLVAEDKTIVGKAQFQLDDDGRLMSLKFTH